MTYQWWTPPPPLFPGPRLIAAFEALDLSGAAIALHDGTPKLWTDPPEEWHPAMAVAGDLAALRERLQERVDLAPDWRAKYVRGSFERWVREISKSFEDAVEGD
jgi:hypothetical protein